MRCLKAEIPDLGVTTEINFIEGDERYVVSVDGEVIGDSENLETAKRILREWFEEAIA